MSSSLEFVKYVCQQIDNAGSISFRKMFGEYCIYCDEVVIGVVCNNQFFVKQTIAGTKIYPNYKTASPYINAKLHLLIDNVDDQDLMTKFIRATCNEILNSKNKKRK